MLIPVSHINYLIKIIFAVQHCGLCSTALLSTVVELSRVTWILHLFVEWSGRKVSTYHCCPENSPSFPCSQCWCRHCSRPPRWWPGWCCGWPETLGRGLQAVDDTGPEESVEISWRGKGRQPQPHIPENIFFSKKKLYSAVSIVSIFMSIRLHDLIVDVSSRCILAWQQGV